MPNKNSTKYEVPFSITETSDIKAIAYKAGFADSRVFEIKATKAVHKNPVKITGQQNGVNYTYHQGKFSNVSELTVSQIIDKGTMDEPNIKGAKQEDHFGYIYTGYIYAPQDGVYGFLTQSDDGSVLYVAGEKVVDNDGSHAAISSTGEIALKAGFHPIKLLYFEDYEGEALIWKWRLPKTSEFIEIPQKNLFVK